MFAEAHRVGIFTVLWCYLRNYAFTKDVDYDVSADLTGQRTTWASRSSRHRETEAAREQWRIYAVGSAAPIRSSTNS